MRLAKQLKRKIGESTNTEERIRLQHDLHVAEVDEAYAVNFPHAEPYISLYIGNKPSDPGEGNGEPIPAAKAALTAERPPIWSTVEKAMEQGADTMRRLRERNLPIELNVNLQHNTRPAKVAPKPQAVVAQPKQPVMQILDAGGSDRHQPQLNRRERRRLMHKTMSDSKKSADEDDGGGFFEGD